MKKISLKNQDKNYVKSMTIDEFIEYIKITKWSIDLATETFGEFMKKFPIPNNYMARIIRMKDNEYEFKKTENYWTPKEMVIILETYKKWNEPVKIKDIPNVKTTGILKEIHQDKKGRKAG